MCILLNDTLPETGKTATAFRGFSPISFLRRSAAFLLTLALPVALTTPSFAQSQMPSAPVEQPAASGLDVTRCSDAGSGANPDCQKAVLRMLATKKSSRESRANAEREAKAAAALDAAAFAEQDLVMYAGEVVLLKVGKVDRVAIGNGKIVSSSVLDDNRLLIIAQDVGDTNLLLWDKTRPIKDIRVRVTAQNMERIKREAANLLAEIPGLKIANVGDRIFIEGYDLSEADLNRVKALAAQYPSIIDRTVGQKRPPKPADPSAMIMFDLYFVEFKKSFLQNLGVRWQGSFNGFNVGMYGEAARGPLLLRPGIGGANGVQYEPPLPNERIYGTSVAANVSISVPAIIEMAVNSGEAVLLAAPKIASRSGSKAKFTAGGEIPLPTSNALFGTSVTFKSYGILLEVEPQINADETVSGIVRAEVSQVDPSISVGGIPAFLTRRTEADFFSKSGQAVVLSGLYSMELSKDTNKVPLLGDIPLLKALFSSNGENRKSAELVVFIVPRLHSSETALNQKLLASTNTFFDEQSRNLKGDNTDILLKLKPSSQLWGLESLGVPPPGSVQAPLPAEVTRAIPER